MNRYRVEYTTTDGEAHTLYPDATSREEAVYLAFDEAADQQHVVFEFGSVSIEHESGQWVEIIAHKTLERS